MTKIVGIHGLANKPEKEVLTDWWEKSIREGLEKTCGINNPQFDFEMVYWADLLHKRPQHQDKLFDFDNLYNEQPYTEAEGKPKRYDEGWLDKVRASSSALAGATIDLLKEQFGMDSLADWVLEKTLKDLAFYYDNERKIGNRSEPPQPVQARIVLQDELRNVLLPLKDEKLMLIAHSMGTIIAYDVLRDIGQAGSGFEVAQFITIGSPLGLPHVKAQIIEERDYDGEGRERVRTPSVVTGRWVNYANRKDPVALDTHLRDDYSPNRNGIRVEDDLVVNGYLSLSKKPNHHKSYGYLRTPELSEHIRDFLYGAAS
jgi:pimeloyl-ACP methyl ester carboxylesterase